MQNKKPLEVKAYGHIPHLPDSRRGPGDHKCSPGQAKICTEKTRDWRDVIIVQEKIDGSCVSVYKQDDYTLLSLTRAGYLATSSPYKQHHLFAEWVRNNNDRFKQLLVPGERVVGEWIALAHGTKYNLIHEPLIVFDIMIGVKRKTYLETLHRCIKQDFITPKLLNYGLPMSVKDALKRIKASGHGALEVVEGAVWRVEREGNVDFLCKHVRPDKIDGCYLEVETWNDNLDKWMGRKIS